MTWASDTSSISAAGWLISKDSMVRSVSSSKPMVSSSTGLVSPANGIIGKV